MSSPTHKTSAPPCAWSAAAPRGAGRCALMRRGRSDSANVAHRAAPPARPPVGVTTAAPPYDGLTFAKAARIRRRKEPERRPGSSAKQESMDQRTGLLAAHRPGEVSGDRRCQHWQAPAEQMYEASHGHRCCTSLLYPAPDFSNYAPDLWSYGDSNPRPLACHEPLRHIPTRPYAA